MTAVATCPQCQLQLSVPDSADADSLVKCPVCRSAFPLCDVRLAPMLEMIVVPPAPSTATPGRRPVEDLVDSPAEAITDPVAMPVQDLPIQEVPVQGADSFDAEEARLAPEDLAPEVDEPGETTAAAEPAAEHEPEVVETDWSEVEPGEPEEVITAIEPGPLEDDEDQAEPPGYDDIDELDEDNTPLENPDPTEFDEALPTAPPLVSPIAGVYEITDRQGSWYSNEPAQQASETESLDKVESEESEEAAGYAATAYDAAEHAEVDGLADDADPQSTTESIELESPEAEVPASARETVAEVSPSGQSEEEPLPQYEVPEEPAPPVLGEPVVESMELPASETADEQVDEPQADGPEFESPLHDEPAWQTNFDSGRPDAAESELTGESASRFEADVLGTSDEGPDDLPPIPSWPAASSAEPAEPAVADETADTQPDGAEIEPFDRLESASDDHAQQEPGEQQTEFAHGIDTHPTDPPAGAPDPGDDPTVETAETAEEVEDDKVDQPQEAASDDSQAPGSDDRESLPRGAQIPLPGMDMPESPQGKSWFSSWLIVLAVGVLGTAGAAGAGAWWWYNGGQPGSAPLGNSDLADAGADRSPTDGSSGPGGDPGGEIQASFDQPVDSPRPEGPSGPEGGEPNPFQEDDAEPLPPAGRLVDAPSYSMDELSAALEEAQSAEQSLLDSDLITHEEMKADSYVYFCNLAEKVTFFREEPGHPDSLLIKLEARDIFRRVLQPPSQQREVAQLATMWLDSQTRVENGLHGIVIAGTLTNVRYRGGVYEYYVASETGQEFSFVMPERLDRRIYPRGEPIVAAGSIVDQPTTAIEGYDGESEQTIWAGVVKPLARSAEVPKDERLSIFKGN